MKTQTKASRLEVRKYQAIPMHRFRLGVLGHIIPAYARKVVLEFDYSKGNGRIYFENGIEGRMRNPREASIEELLRFEKDYQQRFRLEPTQNGARQDLKTQKS